MFLDIFSKSLYSCSDTFKEEFISFCVSSSSVCILPISLPIDVCSDSRVVSWSFSFFIKAFKPFKVVIFFCSFSFINVCSSGVIKAFKFKSFEFSSFDFSSCDLSSNF